MIHICEFIPANSETVLCLFKNLADAVVAQLKGFVTFLMSEIIVDHLQIIQVKQHNACFLQLRCLFIQLPDGVLVSISVHGFCKHICVGNLQQIQNLLLLNILVIKAGHLYPDQDNNKSHCSKRKEYGCSLKMSCIV